MPHSQQILCLVYLGVTCSKAIATQHLVEPSTVALAWIALRGVIPILGVSSVTQLTPNLRFLDVQLTSDQVNDLNTVTAVPLDYPGDLLKTFRQQN